MAVRGDGVLPSRTLRMLLPKGEVLLFKLGDEPIQLSRASRVKCLEWREEGENEIDVWQIWAPRFYSKLPWLSSVHVFLLSSTNVIILQVFRITGDGLLFLRKNCLTADVKRGNMTLWFWRLPVLRLLMPAIRSLMGNTNLKLRSYWHIDTYWKLYTNIVTLNFSLAVVTWRDKQHEIIIYGFFDTGFFSFIFETPFRHTDCQCNQTNSNQKFPYCCFSSTLRGNFGGI